MKPQKSHFETKRSFARPIKPTPAALPSVSTSAFSTAACTTATYYTSTFSTAAFAIGFALMSLYVPVSAFAGTPVKANELLNGNTGHQRCQCDCYQVLNEANEAYDLAVAYLNGHGVDQSDDLAIEQLKTGARLGSPEAMLLLSQMYMTGRGVPASAYMLDYWLEKAAQAGNSYAIVALETGKKDLILMSHAHGKSSGGNATVQATANATIVVIEEELVPPPVEQTLLLPDDMPAEMEETYALAMAGDAAAQTEIGLLYFNGDHISQSYHKAYDWFETAAVNRTDAKGELRLGDPRAQFQLGFMHARGYHVEQDFDQAVAWYRQAIEQNNMDALRNMGFMYETGRGVRQSFAKAAEFYACAADPEIIDAYGSKGGSALAQSVLGKMYYDGRGVEQDYQKAFDLYHLAADTSRPGGGNPRAQFRLGLIYATGTMGLQDDQHAIHWYQKAAAANQPDALHNMGYMYAQGRGVPQSDEIAMTWYLRAAEHGSAIATYRIGRAFYDGVGVETNHEQAKLWLQRATEMGHGPAVEDLNNMAW